jgi:hypothetical protein
MAFYSRTVDSQYLAGSAAAIVTAPANTTRVIQKVVLHNTDTSIVSDVKLYLVAKAGSAGVTNLIENIGSLAVNETRVITSLSVPLYDGQSIHGVAGTASKVNVIFAYSERTD